MKRIFVPHGVPVRTRKAWLASLCYREVFIVQERAARAKDKLLGERVLIGPTAPKSIRKSWIAWFWTLDLPWRG